MSNTDTNLNNLVSKVYNNLLEMEVDIDLDSIPSPLYIQEKIIECNDSQRKVEKYYIECTQLLSRKERLLRTEKLNIEVLRRQTLVNNEKIKKLPTGNEREAAVGELLEDKHYNLLEIENQVSALKDVLNAIKTVQRNLKATNMDVKVLVRVMEQQVNRLNMGSTEDKDVKELRKSFSEIDDLEKSLDDEINIDDDNIEILNSGENDDDGDVGEEDGEDNDKVSTIDEGISVEEDFVERKEKRGLFDDDGYMIDDESGDSGGNEDTSKNSSDDTGDIGIDIDLDDLGIDIYDLGNKDDGMDDAVEDAIKDLNKEEVSESDLEGGGNVSVKSGGKDFFDDNSDIDLDEILNSLD